MAIFSVSDIFIALTLLINALALMSSKLMKGSIPSTTSSTPTSTTSKSTSNLSLPPASSEASSPRNNNLTGEPITPGGLDEEEEMQQLIEGSEEGHGPGGGGEGGGETAINRISRLAQIIRSFSATLVLWNIIFFILMLFVFPE